MDIVWLTDPRRAAAVESRALRAACDRALLDFLRGRGNPCADVARMLAVDPSFVPAHVLRAGMAVAEKDRSAFPALDASLAAAKRLGADATPRERAHLAAAWAWRRGGPERAARMYTAIARRWPRDGLALRLAQSCHFFLGDHQALHDVAAEALPHWPEDQAGHDCVLSMVAFGHEALGDAAGAEALCHRALAVAPRNPALVHVMAHALATGQSAERGVRFLEAWARDWVLDSPLACHNWWHAAIFKLALGRTERALAIYDTLLAPRAGTTASDAADAAALLWRIELAGGAVGDRWHAVAAVFAAESLPTLWPLIDLHAALAFIASGRVDDAWRLRSAIAASARGSSHAARVGREVTLPALNALEAYAAGHYATSATLLARCCNGADRLGGSRLQREILTLTLREAAARSHGACADPIRLAAAA
jgi:tetratricopeptide (TPR) repeat protein